MPRRRIAATAVLIAALLGARATAWWLQWIAITGDIQTQEGATPVNFMGVEIGDAVHLGGVQVVEIQATGGHRFRIIAGKRTGAKETRASALCDELVDNGWRPTRQRFYDVTINGSQESSRVVRKAGVVRGPSP